MKDNVSASVVGDTGQAFVGTPFLRNGDMDAIDKYLHVLFDGSEGYVYAPVKMDDGKFHTEFFEWPVQRDSLRAKIEAFKDKGDLYVGPVLYREPTRAIKSNVLHSNTVWVEFDGNYSQSQWGIIPRPTMEILSSKVGRVHCYWRLHNPISGQEIEKITRGLTYSLNADSSGWDSTQILRPPSTFNGKHGIRTNLLVARKDVYDTGAFSGVEKPPTLVLVPNPGVSLPEPQHILAGSPLSGKAHTLFTEGPKKDCDKNCPPECSGSHRSEGLMELGYLLAERGYTPNEMISLLLDADERFLKFKGREDQMQRLLDIVTKAKQKYPEAVKTIAVLPMMSMIELIQSDIKVEWVWEDYLAKSGSLIISGAPGIGKSQFSLDAGAHFATGEPFLGFKMAKQRVGYLSLEMGPVQLKNIVEKQLQSWASRFHSDLNNNLILSPRGEPLYLDREDNQAEVEKIIKEQGLDGIIIDALSSTSPEEFSSEKVAKSVMDWVLHIQQSLGCFIWFIHHNRKATTDNKKPNSLSDIHGAVLIAARMDTAIILWKDKSRTLFLPRKTRMSGQDQMHDYELTKDQNFTFRLTDGKSTLPKTETTGIPTGPNLKFKGMGG